MTTAEPLEDPGHPELVKMIQDRIMEAGKITFAEFMERALYTPELGYYTSPGEKTGPGGDYYTSPDLHPLFGQMVAKQMAQIAEQSALGKSSNLAIVEMGAGKGLLCQDILNYLKQSHPQFYQRMTYWIIEKSPSMIQRQPEKLLPHIKDGKAKWAEDLQDPVFSEGIAGFVLSNELLDAFPVHRMVKKEGELKEIYVTLEGERFVEVLDIPSSLDLAHYFRRFDLRLAEGQQVEVNLRALDWIRQVGRKLNQGVVITIDYGYPAMELYSPRRKRGTFLCYYKHRVSEDPYIRIGWQDMTAHVDFTSLAQAGQEVGLEVTGFTDQGYFLISLGITQAMEDRINRHGNPELREQELQAMKQLIAPNGLGKVFKILIQHKALEDLRLDGLTYRPFGPEALFFMPLPNRPQM